jgi:hypothetical protein
MDQRGLTEGQKTRRSKEPGSSCTSTDSCISQKLQRATAHIRKPAWLEVDRFVPVKKG